MSETAQYSAGSIRVLMVPWHESHLLLPNSAVVEVLRYPEIDRESAAGKEWISGTFKWRNRTLPLVPFERLLGLEAGQSSEKKRVLVCHLLSEDMELPFVGIEVEGMPRLFELEESELKVTDAELPDGPLIAQVNTQDTSAYIPDLEGLGRLIQDN